MTNVIQVKYFQKISRNLRNFAAHWSSYVRGLAIGDQTVMYLAVALKRRSVTQWRHQEGIGT